MDGVVGVDVVPVRGVLEGDGAAERAGLGQVVAARGAAGGGRGGAVLVGGRGDLHCSPRPPSASLSFPAAGVGAGCCSAPRLKLAS